MPFHVRTIDATELPRWIDSMTTAFLERPDVAAASRVFEARWDLARAWAAFEGDRICGTFRSWATELTVPGGARLPAAAVAAVTVLPTHRRRGILRALTAAEHGAMRERGEVLGLLHAAEFPIYGRFGYGPATWTTTWTLDTRSAEFIVDRTGAVELASPSPEVRDQMQDAYEVWRLREPASLRRRDYIWDMELGLEPDPFGHDWKGFTALHRDASGSVDGYVRYRRTEDHWDANQPRNVVQVDELLATTDGAHADLWRFLSEMDWVAKVKAEWRSPSDRLPWLLANARAASSSDPGDDLWVRIHDVARALEARTYERSDRLVLEVIDGESTLGSTRVALDGGPDGARCLPTTEAPDLALHVATLGAIYLGGTPLRHALVRFGGEEHRPGTVDRLDGMMRTLRAPWCTTFF